MSDSIELNPHAKINLGLIIKGKRLDGYHLLETLLYPIQQLKDRLVLKKVGTKGCSIRVEGIPIDAISDDNLCVKAYHLLDQHIGLPGIDIHLEKQIPSGAGLGGGSSDAAFTLRGLNELLGLGLSLDDLSPIAAKLGADVPFFLQDKALLAKDIGTQFEDIGFEMPYNVKIISSGIHSSTIAAYKELDIHLVDTNRSLIPILRSPVAQWKDQLVNDLEVPVFKRYPQLKETKIALYEEGAVYAAMSGSGSAVFGLFKQK